MAMTVHCDIVSAEGEIFSGLVEMVIAHGSLGDLGIALGHAPLITELKPGPIRLIKQGGEAEVFYISGGYLEGQPNMVKVLADTVQRAADLDEAKYGFFREIEEAQDAPSAVRLLEAFIRRAEAKVAERTDQPGGANMKKLLAK